MCGIAGIVGNPSQDEGRKLVQKMNQLIQHRGPDDEGFFSSPGFAFGMRRLSIIDLSTGHQPMWTAEGIGIVFNGEIYNYRELRTELERAGVKFRTHSDTEVVLNLYAREGLPAVSKLRGMFGIAIFDAKANVVHLVRDRLGIKPLYYSTSQGVLRFGSEIKAIVGSMVRKPPLNLEAIHHYLTLRYVPAPLTMWEGVLKLEPGHSLTYDLRRRTTKIEPYWKLDFHSEAVDPSRNYEREFEKLFLECVEQHITAADVPVGVMLSGGLDSSAVSAAAVELGHKNFHTFNVFFDQGGAFSEAEYAREMARHIGSQHHEVKIGQREFLDFLPRFTWYSDEPIADLASIPLYYVSKLARESVKVVLTGEGSDEILAGYDIELLAKKLDRIRRMDSRVPKPILGALASILPGTKAETLHALAEEGWSGILRAKGAHITSVWNDEAKQELWAKPRDYGRTSDLIRSWYKNAQSPDPIDQLQEVYCKSWLVEDLLMKADKMSMANSLELRVPFLDHKLVEWAERLPRVHKVGGDGKPYVSKRILRKFAEKRVPRRIIDRPKQGFPVPAYEWLKGDLSKWAESQVLGTESRLSEYFAERPMRETLQGARHGSTEAAHRVWSLVILNQWLRTWL